jgi:hypothetical protein
MKSRSIRYNSELAASLPIRAKEERRPLPFSPKTLKKLREGIPVRRSVLEELAVHTNAKLSDLLSEPDKERALSAFLVSKQDLRLIELVDYEAFHPQRTEPNGTRLATSTSATELMHLWTVPDLFMPYEKSQLSWQVDRLFVVDNALYNKQLSFLRMIYRHQTLGFGLHAITTSAYHACFSPNIRACLRFDTVCCKDNEVYVMLLDPTKARMARILDQILPELIRRCEKTLSKDQYSRVKARAELDIFLMESSA